MAKITNNHTLCRNCEHLGMNHAGPGGKCSRCDCKNYQPETRRFTIRFDIAYRLDVDARDEAEARRKADGVALERWSKAASGYDVAEAGS